MSRKAASSPAQPASYGEAVQQLEQLIAGLESGQLPLEELLGHYQRGTELLTPEGDAVPPAMQAALCGLLARAAGAAGMAGGQAIDLASVGRVLTEAELRAMHRLKTGALLQAAVRMGAACAAPALPVATRAALDDYGAAIGLAFQVVDDILDVTADSAQLGKTAGKDAAADKPTYVSLLGLTQAQALAAQLHTQAHQALDASGLTALAPLRWLADRVVKREN